MNTLLILSGKCFAAKQTNMIYPNLIVRTASNSKYSTHKLYPLYSLVADCQQTEFWDKMVGWSQRIEEAAKPYVRTEEDNGMLHITLNSAYINKVAFILSEPTPRELQTFLMFLILRDYPELKGIDEQIKETFVSTLPILRKYAAAV